MNYNNKYNNNNNNQKGMLWNGQISVFMMSTKYKQMRIEKVLCKEKDMGCFIYTLTS